jgi:TRAP-type mannitol/chloroaromatic compound transport system substrate-binding protein
MRKNENNIAGKVDQVQKLALICLLCFLVAGCRAGTAAPNAAAEDGWYDRPEFSWRMQVIHTTGQNDFKQNQEAASLIYQATRGRLKIEIVPNGTIVPSTEGFQACGEGVFEMHSSWAMYAKGIEYSLLPMTTGNLGMDPIDRYIWLYSAGGEDILQEALDKLNLKLLANEIWGTEVMMSKKPFQSLEDMRGFKMRTSDPRLLDAYNIAGITLPLEEVFTAFSTGTVDAAEFGHLRYDRDLGLADVSNYAIWPDFWNCSFDTTVVVNKDAWAILPTELQLIVEMAFKSMEVKHLFQSQYDSALDYKNISESRKLEFIRMDPKTFIAARQKVVEIEKRDMEQYGGLTGKAYDSINSFIELWYPYKTISAWWGTDLTPEQQLGHSSGQ